MSISSWWNDLKNGIYENTVQPVKNALSSFGAKVASIPQKVVSDWNAVNSTSLTEKLANTVQQTAQNYAPLSNALGSAYDELSEPFTHRQEMMEREDSVNQRTVEDMKKAGLNPAMFTGSAVTSNYGSGHIGETIQNLNGLSTLNQLKQQNWQLKQNNKIAKMLDISPELASTPMANILYQLGKTYNLDARKLRAFLNSATMNGIAWFSEDVKGKDLKETTQNFISEFKKFFGIHDYPESPLVSTSPATADTATIRSALAELEKAKSGLRIADPFNKDWSDNRARAIHTNPDGTPDGYVTIAEWLSRVDALNKKTSTHKSSSGTEHGGHGNKF